MLQHPILSVIVSTSSTSSPGGGRRRRCSRRRGRWGQCGDIGGAGMAADSLRGVVVAPGMPSGALTARAHHSPLPRSPACPPGVAPARVPWAHGATADRLSASCGGSSGRTTPPAQALGEVPSAAGAARRASSCATLRPPPRWCVGPLPGPLPGPPPGVTQQQTMFLVARPGGPHLCAAPAPAAPPPPPPAVAPQDSEIATEKNANETVGQATPGDGVRSVGARMATLNAINGDLTVEELQRPKFTTAKYSSGNLRQGLDPHE
ncbi:unnamed protein product [Prorocentrum cordatum]|uniref:Uncharacterized protein n=1 Tax=Prorocentrum cordatum TaxID=2364126 RepID=A0ABN9SYK7_9DINO|nr:unnamed protein product [Polarella glacialis]